MGLKKCLTCYWWGREEWLLSTGGCGSCGSKVEDMTVAPQAVTKVEVPWTKPVVDPQETMRLLRAKGFLI